MFERIASPTWRRSVKHELGTLPKALARTLPWAIRTSRGKVRSVADVALKNAQTDPHGLAFEMGARQLTWSQLADASSRVAHVLSDHGVRKGDVIALFAANSPFYIAIVLGGARIGATVALINTNLRGRPLAHAVTTSGAKVALVEKPLESALRSSGNLADALSAVLVFGGGGMDEALEKAPGTPFPSVQVEPGDDFIYIYTSGTTGLPKPCRISHARCVLAGASFGPLIWEFKPGDKLYSALPLYHSSAMLLGACPAIVTKTPMAMRESFSASKFWEDVNAYGATAMLYIGELCRYLVNTPEHPKEKGNRIRIAVGNGLRPDVWPEFQRRFKIPLIREFYGATEAPAFIINLSGREGSVGRVPFQAIGPLKLVRYDVEQDQHPRDANGFYIKCDPYEVGELLIRIPQRAGEGLEFRGYKDSAATEKKIVRDVFEVGDEYFRSGDLLRRDAEGFFYFVDRIGDTFRWKGENVSTAEVADVLSQDPSIAEATVVGVHVPGRDGQAGLAAIVPNGNFNPETLWKATSELPDYAQPCFVRVMNQLDTTGTFKIQKNRLRDEGTNPSALQDPLYLRTEQGYVPLTPELWTSVTEGTVRL